jgi:syntaxin 18
MVNLTQKFVDIVDRIELQQNVQKVSKPAQSLINDTFVKECIDLHKHIHELDKFLNSVKPKYLLFNNESSPESFSDADRDEIDSYSRIKLKEYNSRLNHLQKYESKRVSTKQHFKFNKAQSSTVNKHRDGILLSLNRELRNVSKLLLNIQETRLIRTRDVEDDGLNNRLSFINVKSLKYNPVEENNYRSEVDQEFEELPYEQLQLLENENNEILASKLNDLAKVEQINKSVLEISQLESELSTHLTVQSENINGLVNDHDITNIDIIESNKLLKSAKNKGNYSIKVVIYTSVTLGLILLFYDFIN